jgi:hypothetical protein
MRQKRGISGVGVVPHVKSVSGSAGHLESRKALDGEFASLTADDGGGILAYD